MNNKYIEYSDEELIELFRNGDEAAMDFLLQKYKSVVKKRAHKMFLVGGDTDDLIQEGMIGLYKAIRDFKSDKDAAFLTFASLCIERQMYTAINVSNRKKNMPLNYYVSFSVGKDDNDGIVLDEIVDKLSNPEEMYIDKENVEYIENSIKEKLSQFELKVIELYIEGNSYQEIAKILDKEPKSIDNALQRIKGKVATIIR